jgi:dienelactone hydrolase
MSAREDITFNSGGERCAAYLYRPEHPTRAVPCVVMGHGFSATRDDAMPGYAERFVAEGLAALVFDYRHFGASTGEPRQLLSISKQLDDWRAAIAFARTLDGVDPERIALWGSSFSGGHVMQIASEDHRLAAVVSQCPFTTGPDIIRVTPKGNLVKATAAGIADLAGSLLGRPPRTIPAVGAPGTFAVMTAPEAEPGFRAIVPAGSRWRNEVAARVMLTIGTYRPAAKAAKIQAPILVCPCLRDDTVPPGPAEAAGHRAPRGEVKAYDVGHFTIYDLDEAKEDQAAFLARHLLGARTKAAATTS